MENILFLQVVKTLIGLFGICGNGLVCAIISNVSFLHTTTNAFIFHQAAIDLLASLFLLLHANVPDPAPLPSGAAGSIFCRVWNGHVILWILLVASTFNLVVLTFERYIAIVFPFRYQTLFETRVNAVILVFVWFLAIGYKSADLARYDYQNGTCVFAEISWKAEMGIIVFMVEYLIPLLIMIFAYLNIILILKKSSNRLADVSHVVTAITAATTAPTSAASPNLDNTLGGELKRARKNTFKTLLIVFAAFVICWTPNQVIFLMFNFGYPIDYSSALYIITVCMASSNCCLNPVIYALKYRQFRKGLRKCFGLNIRIEDGSTVMSDIDYHS
ncbi:galanin receptor 2b-like [Amphiura filiformis]|uniref:galanin receptor 2b-like n=1 Tax=Amphiura filiformis TaxID=82378 RepID=UPI003B215A9A